MIKFEKISFEQFKKDCSVLPYKVSDEEIKAAYDGIMLPRRADKGSAGYDIFVPFGFSEEELLLKGQIVIPLGIKVTLPEDVGLLLFPRSGIGFTTGTRLVNTIGLIDSSYYNNPGNGGHIMIKIEKGYKLFSAKAGDRIVQGIFVPLLFTDDDSVANNKRVGGFGSTGE